MPKIQTTIDINRSVNVVWKIITDIDHADTFLSGLLEIKVLSRPSEGLVGLKWEETRVLFGKKATETMWITEAKENGYYATRAESHGSVYTSKLAVLPIENGCRLVMTFQAEGQNIFVKILSIVMFPLFKSIPKKMLDQDLKDIKVFAEKKIERNG